jgi:hypothetical protein
LVLSCVVVCCLVPGVALDAQGVIRQGGEFQVNRYTVNNQYAPSVALDADGDFIVSWSDAAQEVNGNLGIFAARFNSAGALLGGEFHVNTYTTSIQHNSSVAAESNGDFVIVWQSFGQASAGNYTVFGQRFTSAGIALGSEFRISVSTAYAFVARIASDSDGDFVVVWDSLVGQDGSARGIFGRRFDSSGTPQAVEFIVNSFTITNQRYPAVALDADGDFVVVWESFNNHDGQGYGVFAQRFNSAGARLGIEFQINSFTPNNQYRSTVAAEADGDFVVAWQSNGQDGNVLGVFARRFTSAGVGLATEFQVNTYTTNFQRFPEIAADDSGDFVVTWESKDQDGSYIGVFARRYRASGTPVGGEFQVNSYTYDDQWNVTVDWDSDSDFVVAWQSDLQDPGAGVFAQRFSLPPLATLDVDGNGVLDPLTDGLLVLRDHFGFTGTSLTNAAVGGNCSRCDGTSITNYLTGLGLILDIDNNGVLDPLTDGLLTLRFLFGFTGASLTNNAVAGNCVTRCDAATILTYLQTLD